MPSLIYQLLIKKIQTRTSETVVKDHFLLFQKMEGDSEFISARLLAHDARSGYQDARSCGGKNKSSIWYYVTVLISTNDFRSVVLSAWYEIWPALKKKLYQFLPNNVLSFTFVVLASFVNIMILFEIDRLFWISAWRRKVTNWNLILK